MELIIIFGTGLVLLWRLGYYIHGRRLDRKIAQLNTNNITTAVWMN